jgi:hypothetical protein
MPCDISNRFWPLPNARIGGPSTGSGPTYPADINYSLNAKLARIFSILGSLEHSRHYYL